MAAEQWVDGHERSTAVLLEVDARRGCRAEANPSSLAAVTQQADSERREWEWSGFADGRVAQVTGTAAVASRARQHAARGAACASSLLRDIYTYAPSALPAVLVVL